MLTWSGFQFRWSAVNSEKQIFGDYHWAVTIRNRTCIFFKFLSLYISLKVPFSRQKVQSCIFNPDPN